MLEVGVDGVHELNSIVLLQRNKGRHGIHVLARRLDCHGQQIGALKLVSGVQIAMRASDLNELVPLAHQRRQLAPPGLTIKRRRR